MIREEAAAGVAVVVPHAPRRERVWAVDRAAVVALALLFVVGFALRLTGLGAVGFAEDEINKLDAVASYSRGDITPNAEHPMLMKTLMLVSTRAAAWWSDAAPDPVDISDEAALRFPNVLVGALTVLPLFLLTRSLFDRRTALAAAALWALGVNAITYNRIAKEDTLLVFFMLFAFYFYIRAKQASGFDARSKRKFYTRSGVSFGLMLASKYFPHYFGLNMLYHHLVRLRRREPGEPAGRTPGYFYLVALAAFLVADPAILLPQTWRYLNTYSAEQLLTHHGYLLGDALYVNQVSATPFGTPFYFYLLFLATKVPLPVVAATVGGFALCLRRWREPGPAFVLLMFLLWIVPYSVMGAKWLRYTLSLMPFVYMLAAVGVSALVGWTSTLFKRDAEHDGERNGRLPAWLAPARLATALVVLVFVAAPALSAYASRPHYAIYTNALAADRAGYYFPHDEFYDDGLREAIQFVCERAPRGAVLVHETPGVVRYYLGRFGRTDIQSRVLSDPQFRVEDAPRPAYFIIQRGRTYFENRDKMDDVRARLPKIYEGRIGGAVAVEVYEAR
ncbi:MAG: glycosyltransferase family 39 protein [Pyrinomonadaceae bacterium]